MLNNKTYLIIGASSGIGRASAIAISKAGGRVVLSSRNESKLQETLLLMDNIDKHFIMPYDVCDINGIKEFVKKCINITNTTFDGLVFCAGSTKAKLIKMEKINEFEEDFLLGYKSYLEFLKVFSSKRIIKDGGSIVALSSRAALFPEKALVRYATIKAAMNVTSQIAAQEFARRKIRVNTICPEMTKTPMVNHFFDNVTEEQLNKLYPLGFLEPDDVANLVVFLLSDMSKKLTGQNFYLSAGNSGTPIEDHIL